MRFFSGVRDPGKKKVSPSALYKQQMSGKVVLEKTPEEKYQDVLDAKAHKMMEEALMGRKKQAKVLGMKNKEVDDTPKALSKNAQLMLKLLAMQKMKRDDKIEKKKLRELMWAEKAKKKARAMEKAAQEALEYQQKLAAEEAASAAIAAATATQTPYAYAHTTDDSNGW